MALKIEWAFQFERFPSNKDKQFCYQFREFDFQDAYVPLDTMSPKARANATALEIMIFQSNEIVRDRVMRDRKQLANVLCEHFRETLMEVLEQHDTIDGYPKS